MSGSDGSILYLDPDEDRATHLGDALSDSLGKAAVDVEADPTEWRAQLGERRSCVVVGSGAKTGFSAVEVVDHVVTKFPSTDTVLVTDPDQGGLVEEAYDTGVDEVVQYTGAGTGSVLVHHVSKFVATGDASTPTAPAPTHLRELADATNDAIITIDTRSVVQYATSGLENVLGYEPGAVVGESLTTFMDESMAERHLQGIQRYLETGEQALDWTDIELVGQHREGHAVPLSVSFAETTVGQQRYFTGIVRDITDRHRREERLAQLNEVAQALTGVETAVEVADVVVESASELLELPASTVQLYDESTGQLEPVARTPPVTDLVGDGPLFAGGRTVPWRVYAENDSRVFDRIETASEVSADETPLESAMVVPVGTHGVFVTGSTTPEAFGQSEVTIANILASNAQAALDRVGREQELRTQKERLEERNETLERVERLNGVIRNITQSLARATTRSEIESAVCGELAGQGPFAFCWIAEQATVASDDMESRTAAGDGDGFLDAVSASTDADSTGDLGPTELAFRNREAQVHNSLHGDPPLDPWRVAAIERNFRSCLSVPIIYEEKCYGVLSIYGTETGLFDDMEVAVLEELGEMVGYAINAREREKMLVSDAAVALEFELDDPDIPAIRFARETGGRFEFDELVQETDGRFRVFFTVAGVDPETIYEFGDRATSVRDLTFITERDDELRFEATIRESGFFGTLLSYGAYPKVMATSTDGARLEVELPRSGDVQSFIQLFLDTYEGAELVARQERDRPVQTREEFEAVYKDVLTMRQEEVLKTAYASGFFEWPREHTGAELAEMLDVSQPTVNRHIRNGERKLFGLVFDDNQPNGG